VKMSPVAEPCRRDKLKPVTSEELAYAMGVGSAAAANRSRSRELEG
jgi:hypothetical protein